MLMVLDTSAILAILQDEPERAAANISIESAASVIVTLPSAWRCPDRA